MLDWHASVKSIRAPPTFPTSRLKFDSSDVAKMASRRQAFQNNPALQRFLLPGVRPTGRRLGTGSYGSVEELEVNGVVCAGKRLHEILLEQCNAGMVDMARKYLSECQVTAVVTLTLDINFA